MIERHYGRVVNLANLALVEYFKRRYVKGFMSHDKDIIFLDTHYIICT